MHNNKKTKKEGRKGGEGGMMGEEGPYAEPPLME